MQQRCRQKFEERKELMRKVDELQKELIQAKIENVRLRKECEERKEQVSFVFLSRQY